MVRALISKWKLFWEKREDARGLSTKTRCIHFLSPALPRNDGNHITPQPTSLLAVQHAVNSDLNTSMLQACSRMRPLSRMVISVPFHYLTFNPAILDWTDQFLWPLPRKESRWVWFLQFFWRYTSGVSWSKLSGEAFRVLMGSCSTLVWRSASYGLALLATCGYNKNALGLQTAVLTSFEEAIQWTSLADSRLSSTISQWW